MSIDEPTLTERLLDSSASLVPTVKAYFVGEAAANESKALVEQNKSISMLSGKGSLESPYPFAALGLVFENSSNLRQNVDAYVTNIDSFGHTFVPVLDIDDKSADEKIRDALRAERNAGKLSGAVLKDEEALLKADKEPTDAEVKKRKDQLVIEIRAEREMLESFFENCTPTMPFSGPEGLRGLTRLDIEVFGNGYWEVLRNKNKQITQFNRIEGRSVRLMPEDETPVETLMPSRVSLLTVEQIKVRKRFRRYVQAFDPGTQVVFFKEFGDPRCVDAKTGNAYKDLETMTAEVRKNDPEAQISEATEIFPFKVSSVRGAYGVPRWMGTLLCVLGTRQAEEVNFLYFENRSVPPMAILVSGGHLNADTVKRLEDYIANEIRGKRNFHKMMILEAEAGATADPALAGKMKIVLQPLTAAQQQDALFQAYDERNADKVGQAFRLPRILRGDIRDFNRSTAEAALDFAELQVFGPLRQDFDWRMNKLIFPAIGIKYHTFRSNAPTVRDPVALSEILVKMVTANILIPAEARELAEQVFNRPLSKIDDPWTQMPMAMSVAGRSQTPGEDGVLSVPGAGPSQAAVGAGASKPTSTEKADLVASGLAKIHAYMLKAEREEFKDNLEDAETVKVPQDLFLSFFESEAKK